MKIERIYIQHQLDGNADTSWLGEYTNRPDYEALSLGTMFYRTGFGYVSTREYNFFDSGLDYWAERTSLSRLGYSAGQADYLIRRAAHTQYARMEALNNGVWTFIGVQAVAVISIGRGQMEVTTPGLWEVESDSGDEYLREVAVEECKELRDMLLEMRLPAEQITEAMEQRGPVWE